MKIDAIDIDALVSRSKAIKNAEKRAQREKELRKEGWRWVRIDAQTLIFVPCDAQGNPTEVGQEKIKRMATYLGKMC